MTAICCALLLPFVGYSQEWMLQSAPKLYRGGSAMVIGYHGPYISLIGGLPQYAQMQQYNRRNNTMIDHGQVAAINIRASGQGQYYTQLDNDLFFTDDDILNVYHLDTNSYDYYWNNIDVTSVNDYACLTSNSVDNHLFILGGYARGYTYLDILQILDTDIKIRM